MNKVTITIIGGGSGGGRGGVLGREVMINGQSPSVIF